jgi:hypothetical protein
LQLIVVDPAHIAIDVVQIAAPGVEAVLSNTPEESADPNTGVTTSDIAITTWESGKTTCISSGASRIPS